MPDPEPPHETRNMLMPATRANRIGSPNLGNDSNDRRCGCVERGTGFGTRDIQDGRHSSRHAVLHEGHAHRIRPVIFSS